jgi:hypothetical protein
MAAPARTTQSLALVAADGAAASARATQSLVLVASAGGAARTTQSLVLLACEGPEQAAAQTTQSLALLACEGPEAAAARVTQATVLVAAPSPAPSRVTQGNILVAADRDTTGPNITQALVLVCSEDAAAAVEGPRTTQSLVLVASEGAASPRVTQALVLLASGPSCPDTRDGIRSFGLREITDRVLECLGEQTSSPTYWTRAEIGRMANDAAREFCRRTRMLEEIYTATTAVGTTEYPLPATMMKPHRVFLDGATLPAVTALELDLYRDNWQGQSGEVHAYVQNHQAIILDQSPTEAEALQVWGYSRPTDMEDACDDAGTPAWTHQALVFMTAARALEKGGEQQNEELAAAYRALGESYITLASGYVAQKAGEA